jgi:hypothetical protein
VQEAAVTEEAVEVLGDGAELVTQPAPGVICVREDRGRRGGEDSRGFIVYVEDGRGSEPAALGEDQVGNDLHYYWSLGLCILKKKGLKPYISAKKMPARM